MHNSQEAIEYLLSMIGVKKDVILKKISEYDKTFNGDQYYEDFIEAAMCNLGIDNKCKVLLSNAKSRILKKNLTNQAYYILANCEYNIAILKNNSSNIDELINIKEYQDAKKHFLKVKLDKSRIIDSALTNAGNILNIFGRHCEAILLHDKVISKNPSFGIALGNKALELKKYVDLAPQKSLKLLDISKGLFLKALDDPNLEEIGEKGTKDLFIKEVGKIESELKKANYKNKKTIYMDHLTSYQKFNLKHNLYLNYDFGIYYDNDSLTDSLLPELSEPIEEKDSPNGLMSRRVYFSYQVLNQIIEMFVSSRYLFFNIIKDEYQVYDDKVNFVYTYDSVKHNHQFGLLKSNFCNVYNCLDKIARLVLYYFSDDEIEYNKDIKFDHLTDKPDLKKIIKEKNNKQLLALYSLSMDFKSGYPLYKLRYIRNKITHSYLNVIDQNTNPSNSIDEDQIQLEDLIKNTFELFQIVKSALLYFEISVRKSSLYKNTFPMFLLLKKDIN